MMRLALAAMAFVGSASAASSQTTTPSNGAHASAEAPSHMSRRDLETELTRLRAIVSHGAVQGNRPIGCLSQEYRQLDYWVGEWDVYPSGTGVVIAESTISQRESGCVIHEEWRPFRGAHGESVSIYDGSDRHWHQTYVTATGIRTEYTGNLDANGAMRLDVGGATPPARMSYQRLDANTVRQWGEQQDANGQWLVTYDLTYRRRGLQAR